MRDYWIEYQRRRWMKPNAAVWMRPDAARWLLPNQKIWMGPKNREAKYSPEQPRVPAGNSDGGQWTSGGGSDSGNRDGVIRLAGEIPTPDSPGIPKEPPPTTKLRNIAVRALARVFGRNMWLVVEAGSWVYDHKAEIDSFFDEPRSLGELQQRAQNPEDGYDVHHIVEQTAAERDGFSQTQINDPENLVLVPRWRHWLINSWYQIPREEYDGLSAREYLRGQPWELRRLIGLRALIDTGVLKP